MTVWKCHPAADVSEPPLARFAGLPREPDLLRRGLRAAAAIAMRAVLRIYHGFELLGRENLPAGAGSYVLVANHASHLDALCLLSAVPFGRIHRAYPAAARDYFFRSSATTALSATLLNALPFDRAGNVRHSINGCRALLRCEGNVLIVFPEGTRSTSGAVGPFRRGVGDLVAGTDVPVVPCYLDGAHEAMPKGAVYPRPHRVRLVIGLPRTYAHLSPCKASARAIGDDLRRAVLALAPSAAPDPAGGFYDSCRSPAGPFLRRANPIRPAGKAA